jgi:hypothetical protein
MVAAMAIKSKEANWLMKVDSVIREVGDGRVPEQ